MSSMEIGGASEQLRERFIATLNAEVERLTSTAMLALADKPPLDAPLLPPDIDEAIEIGARPMVWHTREWTVQLGEDKPAPVVERDGETISLAERGLPIGPDGPEGPRQSADSWPKLFKPCALRLLVPRWAAMVRREAARMAHALAREADTIAHVVIENDAERDSVLARPVTAERWAWPVIQGEGVRSGPGWRALWSLRDVVWNLNCWAKANPETFEVPRAEEMTAQPLNVVVPSYYPVEMAQGPRAIPDEVAWKDVVEWAQPALKSYSASGSTLAQIFVRESADGEPEHRRPTFIMKAGDGSKLLLCPYHLGLLFLAWREVQRDRRRPFMAIDAGRPHADLVGGWRDVPKDKRKKHKFEEPERGRVELLAPDGKCVQLSLALDVTAQEEVARNLKAWRGTMGLRHWAALQRLWSVEGGRSGEVMWTLDAHLEALGYSRSERSRTELRARMAEEVRFLTMLELAVYDKAGKIRERRALVIRLSETDELKAGGAWLTSAMRLKVNPLLYDGVRSDDGTLGTNWHPAPAELAQVDHKRHPYALTMGLVLPIRWMLELKRSGKDHVALTGQSLLALAGIAYRQHDPKKAWASLEHNLTELRRIGGVGRWAWDEGRPSLAVVCRLFPAEWATDRTVRGIKPIEFPPGPQVLTGEALRDWRAARGFTQGELARRLGVSQAKVSRLEARGLELLPSAMAAQVQGLMGAAASVGALAG